MITYRQASHHLGARTQLSLHYQLFKRILLTGEASYHRDFTNAFAFVVNDDPAFNAAVAHVRYQAVSARLGLAWILKR